MNPAKAGRESSADQLNDLFTSLLDRLIEAARTLRFNRRNPQHVCAVALHATLLELCRGFALLLRDGDRTGPPLLLRTALEAYVDLVNVVQDADYVANLQAAWQKERLKIVRSAAASATTAGNPYLQRIAESENLHEARAAIETELDALRSRGRGALSVRERFERAGELDRYVSVYAQLSWRSHNNLPALESRHIEQTDGDYKVVVFQPLEVEEALKYADTLAGLSANSFARLTDLLGSGAEQLDGVKEALEAWRAYLGSQLRDPRPESS